MVEEKAKAKGLEVVDSEEDDDDFIPDAHGDSEEEAASPCSRKRTRSSTGGSDKRLGPTSLNEVEDGNAKRKQAIDDIWAELNQSCSASTKKEASSSRSVSSDTGAPSESRRSISSRFSFSSKPLKLDLPVEEEKAADISKQKILYDFAGETVVIEKSVEKGMETAPRKIKSSDQSFEEILGLNKQKMTTTEKSQVDWNRFKTKEGIEDELAQGAKKGYLDRQDFLKRAELREFERDLELRKKRRKL